MVLLSDSGRFCVANSPLGLGSGEKQAQDGPSSQEEDAAGHVSEAYWGTFSSCLGVLWNLALARCLGAVGPMCSACPQGPPAVFSGPCLDGHPPPLPILLSGLVLCTQCPPLWVQAVCKRVLLWL